MDPVSALIALAIATVFIAPAVRWPVLGRRLVALMFLVVAFQLAVGASILSRGCLSRVGLLAAAAWSIGMLPVIPPDGILIGSALAGAPGAAALILTRHSVGRNAVTLLRV